MFPEHEQLEHGRPEDGEPENPSRQLSQCAPVLPGGQFVQTNPPLLSALHTLFTSVVLSSGQAHGMQSELLPTVASP